MATISVESCASILLLTICYKLARAKISTESNGDCCRWLKFHIKTDNRGGNPLREAETSEV